MSNIRSENKILKNRFTDIEIKEFAAFAGSPLLMLFKKYVDCYYENEVREILTKGLPTDIDVDKIKALKVAYGDIGRLLSIGQDAIKLLEEKDNGI
jgi:hypothetical protein